MRLELVGLDGASAYVSAEEVGRTVGSLRRWASARAGLPSASLLRLKSGCRDLCSDEAPLSEVDARVQALLRLPGGTHNKYFFSGRLEGVRKTPEGGNGPQKFVDESVPEGPHAKDVLPFEWPVPPDVEGARATYTNEEFYRFTAPTNEDLPYAYDALEPSIDAATMKFHHGE